MSPTSLHHFVLRILADNRILFGDLKRLQRDILPARITTREEAEILLCLDSMVHTADREWTGYLTATVRDFAIWGLHPAGSLDRDKAEWLAAALSRADPTRTARIILREILQEARNIDDDARLELEARAGMNAASYRRARQGATLRPAAWNKASRETSEPRPHRAGSCLGVPAVRPRPSDRMEPSAARE
jgi:hypothetical protein